MNGLDLKWGDGVVRVRETLTGRWYFDCSCGAGTRGGSKAENIGVVDSGLRHIRRRHRTARPTPVSLTA